MKYSRLITLLVLFIAVFGCKSVVEDMNINPNEFTDVPATLLLNQATLNIASVEESEAARLVGLWTDQFSGAQRCFAMDTYSVTDDDFNGVWTALYQDGLSPARGAKVRAIAEGDIKIEGIASILEGYYAAEAALLFGDVPFLEADDAFNFPDANYDSQESVLDAALALIRQGAEKAGDLPVTSANSVLTGGITWAEFAKALEARYLLNLRDYPGALAAAKAAFITPESEPKIIHTKDNDTENLYYQFEAEQRSGELNFEDSYLIELLTINSEVSRASAKTNDTNRRAFYSLVNWSFESLNVSDEGYFAADRDFPVIGYPEVQLIIAEAAQRTGDNLEAIAALNNARNYWDGLMGMDDYLDLQVSDFGSDNELLKEILTEKFVSVFGLPTFHDIVRTNNLIGTDLDGRAEPVQRFLYPAVERSANANYPGLKPLDEPTPINR